MPVTRQGPFGEPIYPNAKPDLSMETMMRYRSSDSVEDIARFLREHFAPAGRLIQMTMGSDDTGEPVFTLAVGRKYTEPVHFSSIVVMTDPKSKKKRRPWRHILVVSK